MHVDGLRYQNLAADLAEMIDSRVLAPGERLPSIRRLAETTGASKSTIVEAYGRLEAEGAILSRPGSGFYVAGRTRPLSIAAAEVRPRGRGA